MNWKEKKKKSLRMFETLKDARLKRSNSVMSYALEQTISQNKGTLEKGK